MSLLHITTVLISCLLIDSGVQSCVNQRLSPQIENEVQRVAGVLDDQEFIVPVFTGEALDVVLTAKAALVWDEVSGKVLYEKNVKTERLVASLSKLVTALVVRDKLALSTIVEIPEEARRAQQKGADVRLPIGDHATVQDLLSAGLAASANDAMVALAIAVSGSEEEFVKVANGYVRRNGIFNTRISNATGLGGGDQFSTAEDMRNLFTLAYRDQVLRNYLVTDKGSLTTQEGRVRKYRSTNKLLGTYFPVLAAKTGYTREAGENLVVMTFGEDGQRIGAVVLGSEARFQDMKILVEWIWRNYTWQ